MTPSFQHNTYPHQTYNLNTRKKQQLQELANEITKGCRELQPHVEEHLIKTGQPFPKYPELPKGTTTRTRLTARQLKTVGNIVHDNLASYLTTLETEVRSLISNSSLAGKNPSTGKKSKGDETLPNQLAPFDLTTLYRVNKRHAWWAINPALHSCGSLMLRPVSLPHAIVRRRMRSSWRCRSGFSSSPEC